jgi:YidC/Oxa1 family membrane protein insertase
MLALPFVFVIFIINFEAGLILYWITTNVWTIGQQLLVRKLYPKPVIEAEHEREVAASTPARGKPPSTVMAAADGGNGKDGKDGKDEKGGKPAAKAGAPASGSGTARTKAPPASPRKKKKRSGRRR